MRPFSRQHSVVGDVIKELEGVGDVIERFVTSVVTLL